MRFYFFMMFLASFFVAEHANACTAELSPEIPYASRENYTLTPDCEFKEVSEEKVTPEQDAQIQTIEKLLLEKELAEACSVLETDDTSISDKLSVASEVINDSPAAFYQCNSDDDCVLAVGECGQKVSVSLKAKQCFENAAMIYGMNINCVLAEENETRLPSCEKNVCTLL